ncbi:MAG: bile acid:sodium symporter family protein [Alphaproteobacteria bacterium]
MKNLIINNFNIMMFVGVAIGLIVPGLEHLPKSSAMILISTAIFFSCSNVTMDELRNTDIKSSVIFYIARFLIVPVPIYYTALYFVPDYAMGVLLIACAPVGASATSVAVLLRANSSLALSATVVTNAMAPLVMPVLILMLGGGDIKIDISKLFITLGLGIFLPAIVYFGFVRKFEKIKLYIREESRFFSTVCIAGMVAVVTALEKEYILNNLGEVFYMTIVGTVLFAVLYAVSWLFSLRMGLVDRKTYMICSGVNNTGVSSGLALLYFSPVTVLFTIIAEIPWILGVVALKKYSDARNE